MANFRYVANFRFLTLYVGRNLVTLGQPELRFPHNIIYIKRQIFWSAENGLKLKFVTVQLCINGNKSGENKPGRKCCCGKEDLVEKNPVLSLRQNIVKDLRCGIV